MLSEHAPFRCVVASVFAFAGLGDTRATDLDPRRNGESSQHLVEIVLESIGAHDEVGARDASTM